MKRRFAVIATVAAVAAGVRLGAHHSFVKGEDGKVTTWGCEGAAPASLSRRGFKRGDLKLGDALVVDGYRARDGSQLMDARRVTLADGRIVSGASVGDGGPQ